MNKRGQVTIFIILAVLIVALTALVYSFYPQIRSTFTSDVKNPNAFMEQCLEEDVENAIWVCAMQELICYPTPDLQAHPCRCRKNGKKTDKQFVDLGRHES